MKKFLTAILCLCLTVCFAAAGCADTPPGSENEPPQSSAVTPPDKEENPPKDDDPPGEDDKPPKGDEEPPKEDDPPAPPAVNENDIEGFHLAKVPAQINIVTADGQDITGNQGNQPYKSCTVGVEKGRDGEDFEGAAAQVRIRGNNTADYDKKSFRIKFDKKRNLLGLNGGAKCKNWVLLACYKDVTFLRDAVVFELAAQTLAENGYYASDYAYAEVYVNGAYNGFYMVAEQQQVNANRVNIPEPAAGYTGNDIGYFVEFDGNARMTETPDRYFELNYRNLPLTCEDGTVRPASQIFDWGQAYYTVKNDFYASSQVEFIKNYTENAFKIMYDAVYNEKYTAFNADFTEIADANFTNSKQTVEAVVNLDSLVDTYIIAEVACDNDIDWSSFFFSVDMTANGDKKLTFHAPWDFDSGFGMMRGLEDLDKIFAANSLTNAMHGLNPWTTVLFKADWFKKAVAERIVELDGRGVFTRLYDLIDKVTQTYEPIFAKNYERWDNLGKIVDEVQGDTVTTFKTHAEASAYLKTWLNHRVEFLKDYFGKYI